MVILEKVAVLCAEFIDGRKIDVFQDFVPYKTIFGGDFPGCDVVLVTGDEKNIRLFMGKNVFRKCLYDIADDTLVLISWV